jgi:hypothetical protein
MEIAFSKLPCQLLGYGGGQHEMAIRDALIFSGRRWPATIRTFGLDLKLSGTPDTDHFSFRVSGNGQRWSTQRPLAFWATFAALDLREPGDAMAFLTMRGDPNGYLDGEPYDRSQRTFLPGKHTFTAGWLVLQDELKRIAAAWDEPNAAGVHLISRDPERLGAAQDALYELARPDKAGLSDIEWIAQGTGLVPRARTLRAFMVASAASALRRGIAMRTCQTCGEFFELRRSDAVYCSGSCQAADSKRRAMAAATISETSSPKPKGSLYGKRAKTDSSRPNRIPRRVARKRPGGKGAAAK